MLKLTLDQAIQHALAKNYSIKVQSYAVPIAQANLLGEIGKFDPALTASYIAGRNEAPQLLDPTTGLRPSALLTRTEDYEFGLGGLLPWGMNYKLGASAANDRGTFNLFANQYSTFAGVTATQPLLRDFGFGPTLASIRIAQANRAISEWQFKQILIETITGVTVAYNELNFSLACLRSALRSRELAHQLLTENERRYQVGSMSEFDVTSARSRLASREEAILIAARQVKNAENFLKQFIIDDRTPSLLSVTLDIAPPPPAPIVVVDPAADFRVALKQRPDYQHALLAVKRGDLTYRLRRNQLLPRVDLVGSYGYNGFDGDFRVARHQVRHQDYRTYSAGVAVSVPLSFTAERARYRAAKFGLRQAEADLQRLEQEIVVRVGNAAGQIETTQNRVTAARRARELAQATLDAEVKRLRAGTSSTFFVLQQQEILSGQEVLELRAEADYQEALADYDRQIGVTLDKLHVQIESPR
ncbi:MAG: TolC family protein [Opitutaceae bacterium]|nr:TolC family protein [Opitutaceae bacterium]